MGMKKLTQTVKEIKMSEEMKNTILMNCYKKMEGNVMNKRKNDKSWKKPMVAAVSMAACFCVISVTALATTGKLEGFFKDIKRWDNVIIGTSYEQATGEMNFNVISGQEELIVVVEMLKPDSVPYRTFTTLGIGNYKIIDANGKTVIESDGTDLVTIIEGKANISIPIAELSQGEYKLVVNQFVGSAKAEQPLILAGTWQCEFTR